MCVELKPGAELGVQAASCFLPSPIAFLCLSPVRCRTQSLSPSLPTPAPCKRCCRSSRGCRPCRPRPPGWCPGEGGRWAARLRLLLLSTPPSATLRHIPHLSVSCLQPWLLWDGPDARTLSRQQHGVCTRGPRFLAGPAGRVSFSWGVQCSAAAHAADDPALGRKRKRTGAWAAGLVPAPLRPSRRRGPARPGSGAWPATHFLALGTLPTFPEFSVHSCKAERRIATPRVLGLSCVCAQRSSLRSSRQPCEEAVPVSFTRDYRSPGRLGGSLSHRATK